MRVTLGPLVGAVGATSGSVWLCLDQGGTVTVRLVGADGEREASVTATNATLLTGTTLFRGLRPNTAYAVKVIGADGSELARASFMTLDESPEKFSFTFSSCHRPAVFAGSPKTFALWSLLADKIAASPDFSRLHLHIGDQIYADPVYDSLFGQLAQDPEEHLRARRDGFQSLIRNATSKYAALYQEHWSAPDVQRVLGSVPNLMLWDDHDIADGWGSRASSGWDTGQALFTAASVAYRFFQDAHNPLPGQFPLAFAPSETSPVNYGWGATVGPNVAFLAPDQRSFRQSYDPTANHETGQHPILGDRQAQDISAWLAGPGAENVKFLFFVATVPFFHTSPATIELGSGISELDALDNWIATTNQPDLAFILDQLFSWKHRKPGRMVVVLGGDVHMADAAAIERGGDAIHQLVSSPITNASSGGLLEKLLVAQNGESFRVNGIDATFRLDFHIAERNFGRVTVDVDAPSVVFELYSESQGATPAKTVRLLPSSPWFA